MNQEPWDDLKSSLAQMNRESIPRREYLSLVGEAEDAGVSLIGMGISSHTHQFSFAIRKDGQYRYTEPRHIEKGRKGKQGYHHESGLIANDTFHRLAHFIQAIGAWDRDDVYDQPDLDYTGRVLGFRILFDDGREKQIAIYWVAPATLWGLEQILLKIMVGCLSREAVAFAAYFSDRD